MMPLADATLAALNGVIAYQVCTACGVKRRCLFSERLSVSVQCTLSQPLCLEEHVSSEKPDDGNRTRLPVVDQPVFSAASLQVAKTNVMYM